MFVSRKYDVGGERYVRCAPVLDEGVIVGVGASVIGGVYVAKNVAIGALAVVTKDIKEENVAVAGIPAKPISKNGAVEWKKTAQ